MAPLRIFLLDLLPTVPYYAAALALALRRAGASVTFGLTTYWLDKDHFRSRGLELAPGLVDFAAFLPARPVWLRRLLKLVEAAANLAILAVQWAFRPPEIVHVQFLSLWLRGMPFELWLLAWARRRGSKLVYTVHDVLPHDTGRRHFTRYARLYCFFDALICHSESVRSRLHEDFSIPLRQIWILPHGPLFSGPEIRDSSAALTTLGYPRGTELVLWQGIIHPYKGVLFLLDAWARVAAQRPYARLLIAGIPAAVAPEHAVEITNRIAQLGLKESVRTDYRYLSEGELQSCYSAAAAVVYPYREISTSGALMTGLGQGKAMIATRLPAFTEILTDGENALLVNYGDAEALAAAILRLLDDAALRHRLEQAARASAGRHGWESIAHRTLDHYRSLRGSLQ